MCRPFRWESGVVALIAFLEYLVSEDWSESYRMNQGHLFSGLAYLNDESQMNA